jgi:putative tryptophan/tyrosine transport system substrate-binding protein
METPLSTGARTLLAELGLKSKLPLMTLFGRIVDSGGLISYGPSLEHLWRRAAVYVDKILRGTRAGDLPVELPSTFELVINLSTAKRAQGDHPALASGAGRSYSPVSYVPSRHPGPA